MSDEFRALFEFNLLLNPFNRPDLVFTVDDIMSVYDEAVRQLDPA